MSFEINLNDIPADQRLKKWVTFFELSHVPAFFDTTRIREHGHFYVHQSRKSSQQFALKSPTLLFDEHFKKLTIPEIFAITLQLTEKSTNKTLAQRVFKRFPESINDSCKAILQMEYTEDPQEVNLRSKIKVLRRYLATKNIYGGFTIDLQQQYQQLNGLLQNYWKSLKLRGVYKDNVYVSLKVSESFLAEFEKVPSALVSEYAVTLKKKIVEGTLCYFKINRQNLSEKLTLLLEQSFREAVLEHLTAFEKKKGFVCFNYDVAEKNPVDPFYVQTFDDFLKSCTNKCRRVIFSVYHEGLLELLNHAEQITLFSISENETQMLVNALQRLVQTGRQKLPTFFIHNASPQTHQILAAFASAFSVYQCYQSSSVKSHSVLVHVESYKKDCVAVIESTGWFEDTPVYKELFVDYAKTTYKSNATRAEMVSSRVLCFPHYHESLLEVLPYTYRVHIGSIQDSEAPLLVNKLKEMHQQKIPLPCIWIVAEQLSNKGLVCLEELKASFGAFEDGLYTIHDVQPKEGKKYKALAPGWYENMVKAVDKLVKAQAEEARRHAMMAFEESDFGFTVIPRRTQIAIVPEKERVEEQALRVIRDRNNEFLDRLQSRTNAAESPSLPLQPPTNQTDSKQERLKEEVRQKRQAFLDRLKSGNQITYG